MSVYFYIVLLGVSISAEVITLIKDQNVKCVITEESVYSAIEVVPRIHFKRSVDIIKNWNSTFGDDWEYCDGTECAQSFEIVTDQRWEGFEPTCSTSAKNRHQNGIKMKKYRQSFSIHNNTATTFTVFDKDRNICTTTNSFQLSPGPWSHYSFNITENVLKIQGNIEPQNLLFNSTPDWFSFQSEGQLCKKIHKYEFMYSDSTGESNITIFSSNCIFMYVSVDHDCFLDVHFKKGDFVVDGIVEGFNQDKTSRSWKTFNITNDFDGPGNLHLLRRSRTNGTNECFWAVAEMQKCRNRTEFHDLPKRNDSQQHIICRTMIEQNDRGFLHQNTFPINGKVGILSEDPPLSCSQVLGEAYPNCDNHKICVENGTCFCSWGYRGTFCDETCQTGFWGLNCGLSCSSLCANCNNIKGCTQCRGNFIGNDCQTCQTGFWGLNCNQSCSSNCDICDRIQGCTQCKEEFFGDQCQKKKPILKNAPILSKIINDTSVILTQNMDYGKDEVKPDLFQIEYRNNSGDTHEFEIYGNKRTYENKEESFTLSGLSLGDTSYKVRIILFADETEYTTNNVPALLIFQRALNSTYSADNKTLSLTWENSHINKTFNNYTVSYKCQPLCQNNTVNDTRTTTDSSVVIEVFKTCDISLRAEIEGKMRLLDQIEVKSNVTTSQCGSEVLETTTKSKTNSTGSKESSEDGTSTKGSLSYIWIVVIGVASLIVTAILITIIIIRICKRRRNKKPNPQIVFKLERRPLEMYPLVEKCKTSSNTSAIDLDKFENYLLEALEEDPDDNEITQQYNAMSKTPSKNRKSGQLSENKDKNRYRNIIAYDDSRVILKTGDGENNYINANYIDGYNTPRSFIATQAPLPSTLSDFWHMICQEKVTTIIMLTELRENGIVKCEQYWPEAQSRCRHGKFLIVNISQKVFPNYTVRQLQVSYDNQTHFLQHFQYISWPDHGVPLYTQDYIKFLKKIMRLPQKTPIVVHCNAGCGRTGAFILSDIAIRMATHEKRIDFPKLLAKIRDQRQGLVSNIEQYIFVHYVILEYFFRKDFSIPVSKNFQYDVQKAMDKESLDTLMEYLEKVTTQLKKTRFKYYLQLTDEEKAKNRFPDLVPGLSRLFLPISTSESSNYINAISVDCYRCSKKFIVTQQPLPNTVEDFWTLVKEYDIETIISLNEIPENDPNCPIFWPRDAYEAWLFGNDLKVTFQNQTNSDLYKAIKVKFDVDRKAVNIIDVKRWKRKALTPKSVKDLIRIWKKVVTGTNQIVVTCHDGTTASGLFVALVFLLEKLNMDHVCDVFSAVKTVRESRLEFVRHPDQLTFLYRAALEYIREFSTYGNFN